MRSFYKFILNVYTIVLITISFDRFKVIDYHYNIYHNESKIFYLETYFNVIYLFEWMEYIRSYLIFFNFKFCIVKLLTKIMQIFHEIFNSYLGSNVP